MEGKLLLEFESVGLPIVGMVYDGVVWAEVELMEEVIAALSVRVGTLS